MNSLVVEWRIQFFSHPDSKLHSTGRPCIIQLFQISNTLSTSWQNWPRCSSRFPTSSLSYFWRPHIDQNFLFLDKFLLFQICCPAYQLRFRVSSSKTSPVSSQSSKPAQHFCMLLKGPHDLALFGLGNPCQCLLCGSQLILLLCQIFSVLPASVYMPLH